MIKAAEKDNVKLRLVRNPFDPTSFIEDELVYDPAKSLNDYMDGLPNPNAWTVGYNGLAIQPKLWKEFTPKPGEMISLVRAPEGGGDGKEILRLVALIAVAVVAPYAAGLAGLGALGTAALTTAYIVGGTLLVNALIPPPTVDLPDSDFNSGESSSYGIDGPKNTARQGVPVPVVYGTFRVGGNIVDNYTQNVNDEQYLFMRTTLNDGLVSNISNIEINDQPIENFNDVETRTRLGAETELLNDWFDDAVRLVNKGSKITTDWTTHTSNGDVDKLRLDFVAPQGMVEFNSKGDPIEKFVDLEIQFKSTTASTWNVLPAQGVSEFSNTEFFGGTGQGNIRTQINVRAFETEVDAPGNLFYNQSSVVEYRPIGGTWTQLPATNTTAPSLQQPVWGDTVGTVVAPGGIHTYNLELVEGEYEVRTTDGSTIIETRTEFQAGSTIYKITGSSTKGLRKTIESVSLPRDTYDIRVRRTTTESTESTIIDSVYLADVGEIDTSPVLLNGVAGLSLKIKVTDQINSRPKVTALVEGSILAEYDRDGVFTQNRWSANPAWIVVDILTNTLRGAALATSRLDMDMFVEWADHCTANGIEFNGIFDYKTNVWDAVQAICRVGQAQLIRLGTQWSLAIDRADTPIMIFNDSNIIEDSFSTTWLPMAERANEIQLTYADETDGYNQKTIRLVDDTVSQSGERSSVSSYTEFGITKTAQAAAAAEYQLRRNKLLQKTVTFEAQMDAIAMTLGDLAEIHTTAGDFTGGMSGKTTAGSILSQVELDREITVEAGQTYSLLVYQDAVKLHDVSIVSILGNTIEISGISPFGDHSTIERLVQGANDKQVERYYESGGALYVIVDDYSGLTTGACEFWDTNLIEEREVTNAIGTHTSVTLSTPLSKTPSQYSNWIFGRVAYVRQPFRLIGMDNSDLHTRQLTFIEYNDAIYLPPGTDIPTPEALPIELPQHVRDLSIDYKKFSTGDEVAQTILVTWNKPDTIEYGGADVYVDEGVGTFRLYSSVLDVTQAQVSVSDARSVRVKVVGHDKLGRRASFFSAPVIVFDTSFYFRNLAVPSAITVSVDGYDVSGRIELSWSAPSNEIVTNYRIDTRTLSLTDYNAIIADPTVGEPQDGWTQVQIDDWNSAFRTPLTSPDTKLEIPNLKSGYYQFRVRAERGRSVSDWVVFTYHLDTPDFLNVITGLQTVDGGITFNGRDCELVWDDIFTAAIAELKEDLPYLLKDYQVEVLTDVNTILRTEYVQDNHYVYSYGKNSEDNPSGRARRSFKVRVTARGRQGQTSLSQEITFSNPAPTLTGVPTIEGSDVKLPIPNDADFLGYRIWTKSTNDINTGTDGFFEIKQNAFTVTFGGAPTIYFIYAPLDEFDSAALNQSSTYSVSAGSTGDLTPIITRIDAAEIAIAAVEAEVDEVYDAAILSEVFPGFPIVGGHGSIDVDANVPSASDIAISTGYFDHPSLGRVDVPATLFSTAFGVQFAPPKEWFVVVYSAQDTTARFDNNAGSGNFFPATYNPTNGLWYAWATSMNTAEVFTPQPTDVIIAKAIKTLAVGETQQSDVNGIVEVIMYVRDTNVVNQRIEETEVRVADNTASILTTAQAVVSESEARAREYSLVTAALAGKASLASVSTLSTSLATISQSLAAFEQNVTAEFGTKASIASVNELKTALATLNSALATLEIEINAELENKASVANVEILASSFASLENSLAQLEINIYSSLNQRATKAEVSEIRTALSTTNQAIASLQTSITAQLNDKASLASFNSLVQTVANLDEAQTSLRLSLQAAIADKASQASLDQLSAAVATADEAFAIFQQTVTARFQSNEASVSQVSSALATLDGRLAASYALTLNSNGLVGGMRALNDGRTVEFIIDADSFQVGRPGTTGVRPFQVVGNTVRMSDVEVDNIRANTVTTENLVGSAVTDAIASVKTIQNTLNPSHVFEYIDQIVYYSATGGTIRFEYNLYVTVDSGSGSHAGMFVKMTNNGSLLTPREHVFRYERDFAYNATGHVVIANAQPGWNVLRVDAKASNGTTGTTGVIITASELFMQIYKDDT